jgi:hypothetical protein
LQMPEFVQHCLMSIHDPKSSDGKRSLKGAAYLVASMKLYNGPSSIRADPMKGGIAAAAEKFDLQVHPDHLFLWFIDIFSDLQGKRKSCRGNVNFGSWSILLSTWSILLLVNLALWHPGDFLNGPHLQQMGAGHPSSRPLIPER